MTSDAIRLENVDVLFTRRNPGAIRRTSRRRRARLAAALAACDAGAGRDDVAREHGMTR